MARIFFSHSVNADDSKLATEIGRRLCAPNKHSSILPIGVRTAGNWRAKVMKALLQSDAMVPLLTKSGLASTTVLGEIGTARALEYTRGMLILPVLYDHGEESVPPFMREIWCFKLRSTEPSDIDDLSNELDRALKNQIRLVPRIFISHRHADQEIAAALIALIEERFDVAPGDIRCTSVPGYMLPPGARTAEQLRAEIAGADLVIGILTPDTHDSNYVLCELGAAWGRDVPTFPLLARGADHDDIPAPLNERHSVSLARYDRCLDLLSYIEAHVALARRTADDKTLTDKAMALARRAGRRSTRRAAQSTSAG